MDDDQIQQQPPAESAPRPTPAPEMPSETEPVQPRLRFRRRFRGWLAVSAACALLPVFVALALGQYQFDKLHRQQRRLGDEQRKRSAEWQARLRQLEAARLQESRQRARLERKLHEVRAQAAAWQLAARLATHLAGNAEETARNKELALLLRRPPAPLLAVALVDDSGKVLHHSEQLDNEARVGLSRRLTAQEAAADNDWQLLGLPGQALRLAYRLPLLKAAPKDSGLSPAELGQPPQASTPAGGRWQFVWGISLAIALLLFLLAAIGQRRLFHALERLSEAARSIPLDPSAQDPQDWPRNPELASLSAALSSWRELRLLQDSQRRHDRQLRSELQLAAESLRALAQGERRPRAQLSLPELQPLQLALESLSERLAGRLATANSIATRLQGQAETLLQLAGKLRPLPLDKSESDFSPLADMLDGELEQLAASWSRIEPALTESATAEAATAADLARHLQSLVVALGEHCRRVQQYAQLLEQAPEQAQLLATSLAVIAEAHGLESLATPRQQSLELAENLRLAASGLQQATEELEQVSARLERELGEQAPLWSWSRHLEQRQQLVEQQGQQARQKLNALLPLLKPVTGSYRQLHQAWRQARDRLSQLESNLQQLSEVVANLGESASGLVNELSGWWPELSAPAAVSRQLLHSQQALRQAMQQIEQLSARHGIHSLSAEAERILTDIRQYAEQARQAIVSGSGNGEKTPTP